MARGGLHPFVIRSHPALAAADDEEVLGRPFGATLFFPEALVTLLHFLVFGSREAVSVLLAHHGHRPVTLVEAIARRGLAVTQQPVQLRLYGPRELLDAGIEIGLIGLGATVKEPRGERAFVGGLVALDSGQGHGREVTLRVRLRDAGDIRGTLSVARADRQAAEGRLLDGVLAIRIVDDPGLVDGLRDALLFGNAAAYSQSGVSRN